MKTFAQLREETSSYDQHKKRVQNIQKGSDVSFTSAKTGKKVTGTYKGLKQMGGRSYAHVEHGDGATYVPVHQIHESLNENLEDRHSDESSDFAHMISHVAPLDRKKYVNRFHRHMADFHVAHGNDDDEKMNDSLDGVNNVNSDLYRDSKVKYLMYTDLARLIDHRPNIGFDLYHGIIDAAHQNDHDALNKHIDNLHAYIKQYNL